MKIIMLLFHIIFGFCIGACISQFIDYLNLKNCRTFNGTLGKWIELGSCPVLYNLSIQSPLPSESSDLLKIKCSELGYPRVCCDENEVVIGAHTDAIHPLNTCNVTKGPWVFGTVNVVAIFGGRDAYIGEFPWMAILEYTTENGHQFDCGGSLINNRYVLTAAHCIKDSLVSVRLGEHDTSKPNDCGYCEDSIDVDIAEKIPHEGYVRYTRQHDIGLLRLARKVNFTDFIKPILLPKNLNISDNNYEGFATTVTGWGLTETGIYSDILRKLNVLVRNVWYCKMLYPDKTKIPSSLLCAGGEIGKDTCNADSGGPLMLEYNDNMYAIIGVVSFGSMKCGLENWPAVYTKVSYYMEWIDNKTARTLLL